MAPIPEAAKEAARRGILAARFALIVHRPEDLRTIRRRRDALSALRRISINNPKEPRS